MVELVDRTAVTQRNVTGTRRRPVGLPASRHTVEMLLSVNAARAWVGLPVLVVPRQPRDHLSPLGNANAAPVGRPVDALTEAV